MIYRQPVAGGVAVQLTRQGYRTLESVDGRILIFIAGEPLGGWQLVPIWTAHTGARPDVLRNPNLERGERTIDRWFDTEAIQNPAPGGFWNAGKRIIQSSGVNNWDVNLAKNYLTMCSWSATQWDGF